MNRRAGLFSCFLAWSVLTVLSGCAPSTSLLTPQIAVPQNFEVSGNEKSAPLDRWWDNFDDPQLSSLIQTALTDSTDANMETYLGTGPGANNGAADSLGSEEHTSELQSLMRTSYAVFCLKKKKYKNE